MTMPMGATGMSAGNQMTGNKMQKNKVPSGYRHGQLQNFTPEQFQLFQQMFGRLGPESFLGRLASGDQSQFEQLEAPAMRQFQGLQGQLASRFSGMGTGARRSSGFQNVANQATSDFAQDLQSRRLGLQREALNDLMTMSGQLLQQRPYDQFMVKKDPKTSWWQSLLGGALPIGGAALGGIFGGLPGAKLGGTLGGAASKGFFG